MIEPYPDGTRIEKINSKPGDAHRDGERGRVTKAIGPATAESSAPGTWGYMVEWDHLPGAAIFVAGTRLRPVES